MTLTVFALFILFTRNHLFMLVSCPHHHSIIHTLHKPIVLLFQPSCHDYIIISLIPAVHISLWLHQAYQSPRLLACREL